MKPPAASPFAGVAMTPCPSKADYRTMPASLSPRNAMTGPDTAVALLPQGHALIEEAGGGAVLAAEEFFLAGIRNPHTRRAYGRHAVGFLEWCGARSLALAEVTPGDAAAWIDTMSGSVSTQRVALAALRRFFALLVLRHAVLLNPFDSVRGPRTGDRREGKSALITPAQVRRLLASIDTSRTVGLRDRAVLGTLAGTGARVGAVSRLRIRDLRDHGDHRALRVREKRGLVREIPVRIDLDRWLRAYLSALDDADNPDRPLFRPLDRRTRRLAARPLPPYAIRAMLKRRLRDAGLPSIITPHSFRAMVVTDLLEQGVPIEDVQYLVGHRRSSTTQIYDRRARRVSRNTVERISI